MSRNGRPRSIDKEGRQSGSETLTLRVTPKQMDWLKLEASDSEMSVGEFVRQRVFANTP